jgi:hypothetical protein
MIRGPLKIWHWPVINKILSFFPTRGKQTANNPLMISPNLLTSSSPTVVNSEEISFNTWNGKPVDIRISRRIEQK